MILECLRGPLPPGNHDDDNTIDEILEKNEALARTNKMIELRIARGMSHRQEFNALTTKPSLQAAHQYCRATVPRRVFAIDPNTGGLLIDRVTGRNVTRLRKEGDTGIVTLYRVCPKTCTFHACKQSRDQISDFGVGVALYFKNTLLMAFLCGVMFLFSCPVMYCNFIYKQHIQALQDNPGNLGNTTLRNGDVDIHVPYWCGYNRTATVAAAASSSLSNQSTSLASALIMFDYTTTTQQVTLLQIVSSTFVCFTLLIAVIVSAYFEEEEIDYADETVYTARDYTVEIRGISLPKSPLSYKTFYEHRFPGSRVVRASLVFKGTGTLLRAMSNHLNAEKNIAGGGGGGDGGGGGGGGGLPGEEKQEQPPNCGTAFCQSSFGCCRTRQWWKKELIRCEKAIDDANRTLYANDSPPLVAYVTFDNELSQHRVMRGMRGDVFDRWQIRKDLRPESTVTDHLEAAKHLDAPEPSDIVFENFDVPWCTRFFRMLESYALALVVIVLLYVLLLGLTEYTHEQDLGMVSSLVLAAFITLINLMLPTILKMTSYHELHLRESELQVSMLVKLLLARYMNSAILTFLVTRKNSFLSPNFVSKVQQIMILDLFLPPLLRLFDVYNIVMRYVVSKTSKSQANMNSHFNGTFWNLSERYTDSMKKIYFCFFYSWLCPSGFAITSLALLVDYYVDKYLLFRRWRTPPRIGGHLSIAARVYFYLSVCVSSFMYIWAFRSWPFDCSFLKYIDDGSSSGSNNSTTVDNNMLNCEEEFSKSVLRSNIMMTWPNSESSYAATIGIPALVVILIVAAVMSVKRTFFEAFWICCKLACCTSSKIAPIRTARLKHENHRRTHNIKKLNQRIERRRTAYGNIHRAETLGAQAGLGGILYSQLQNADWYIPRARKSMAEVSKAERVNRWFYRVQSMMQDHYRSDWTFAGQESTDPEEFLSKKIYYSGNWINDNETLAQTREARETPETTLRSAVATVQRNAVPWFFYACDAEQVHQYLDGTVSGRIVPTIDPHHTTIQSLLYNQTTRVDHKTGSGAKNKRRVTIEELIADSPSMMVNSQVGSWSEQKRNEDEQRQNKQSLANLQHIQTLLEGSPSVQQGAVTLDYTTRTRT